MDFTQGDQWPGKHPELRSDEAGGQGGAGEDPGRGPHRAVGGQQAAVAIPADLLPGNADAGAPVLPEALVPGCAARAGRRRPHGRGMGAAGRVELDRDGPHHRDGPHGPGGGERRRGNLLGRELRNRLFCGPPSACPRRTGCTPSRRWAIRGRGSRRRASGSASPSRTW